MRTLSGRPARRAPFSVAPRAANGRRAVIDVASRRAAGRIPAAYLTGEAWLGDYRFEVDPRVIVPRSFIAELLIERLAPWITAPDDVGRVLDLFTGSGCLAIIAADAFPTARGDAVDLPTDALAGARPHALMGPVAAKLSENDMKAVVEYAAGLD